MNWIWIALFAGKVSAVDCQQELTRHLATDLELSYKEFDQTQNRGMRVLSAKGCHAETATLIQAYIHHNQAEESSLRWHLAQQYAMAGEYGPAVEAARTTLNAEEDLATNPFQWNDYVLATIAFLERDKQSLIAHTEAVRKGQDAHMGNQINLKLLEALVRHFDQSYAYATSHLASSE